MRNKRWSVSKMATWQKSSSRSQKSRFKSSFQRLIQINVASSRAVLTLKTRTNSVWTLWSYRRIILSSWRAKNTWRGSTLKSKTSLNSKRKSRSTQSYMYRRTVKSQNQTKTSGVRETISKWLTLRLKCCLLEIPSTPTTDTSQSLAMSKTSLDDRPTKLWRRW